MDCKKMLDEYGVSVTYVSDLPEGGGLVSKCGFSKGSPVTIQDPICHAVRSKRHDKLCSTCFKELPDDKSKCSRCSFNHYCNTDCQKRDWILHKAECRVMATILPHRPSERMRFALRLLMLKKKSIEAIDHLCKLDEDDQAVLEMEALEYQRLCKGNRLIDRLNLSSLEPLLSRESCNSFSIDDDDCYEVKGEGIYILPSFLNHSCRPNCSYVFNGRRMTIMALQDIASGQQLYISYADLLKPKRVRQEFLRNTYRFTCRCPRCSEDSELDLFLDCRLCQKCRRSALAPKAALEGMGIDVCGCKGSSIVVADSSVDSLLTKFEKLSRDCQPTDKSALDKWLKFQTKAGLELSPLHHLSIRVREKIMGAASELPNWEKAYTTAKELEKFYKLFLQPSPLYSVHLATLLEFCLRVEEDNSEQTQLYEKMMRSLKLTHGPDHNLYEEARKILDRANHGSS